MKAREEQIAIASKALMHAQQQDVYGKRDSAILRDLVER